MAFNDAYASLSLVHVVGPFVRAQVRVHASFAHASEQRVHCCLLAVGLVCGCVPSASVCLHACTFVAAHVSLPCCVVALLLFALQLLRWRPCHEVSRVDAEPWFQALWRYSESVDSSDAAADLIPKVVAECAAPRLEAAVRCRWDVFSSRQTRCLSASIRDLLQYDLPDTVKQVRARAL